MAIFTDEQRGSLIEATGDEVALDEQFNAPQMFGNVLRSAVDKIDMILKPHHMASAEKAKFLRRLDSEADKFIARLVDMFKASQR